MSQDVTALIPLLKDAEHRDAAAAQICERFLGQLLPLIRQNMSPRVRQRVDEEDVLQSVWVSFFRHDFQIGGRDQLFALLATIAVRKALDAARRHTAAKRNANQEATADGLEMGRKPVPPAPIRVAQGDEYAAEPRYEHDSCLDENTARLMLAGASPEQALAAYETLERMPDELRAILVMRMQNMTENDIARELGCTRRTVTRRLGVIRDWMLAELAE